MTYTDEDAIKAQLKRAIEEHDSTLLLEALRILQRDDLEHALAILDRIVIDSEPTKSRVDEIRFQLGYLIEARNAP